MRKMRELFGSSLSRVVVVIIVLSTIFAGTALAQVAVTGDFSGTLVGYGDNANQDAGAHPNQITVQGEITVEGEDAVNPRIRITSGPSTVLNTSSVTALVPGEQAVTINDSYGPDTVLLTANRIPAGTTIEISYTVTYQGGTTDNEINAGTVRVNYESPGGTEGQETFQAQTDSSNSPDNVISDLQEGNTVSFVQEVLSYIGGFAVILVVLYIVYVIVFKRDGPPDAP